MTQDRSEGRVLFYVQHLLGIGHLKRAALIARGMTRAGLDVRVVLGGADVPGIRFEDCSRVFLPAVRSADAAFSALVDEAGRPIDAALKDRRTHRLLVEFSSLRPDVVVIELFPFGRRQFRFELLPLLAAVRTAPWRPLVACSVRDVLVQKDDRHRTASILALARRCFDRILVHGDPRLIPFEATFPAAAALADRIVYTGYVVDPPAPTSAPADVTPADGSGEVIVSCGGGAVGEPLLRAALAARPLCSAAGRVWRLLAGPNLPNAVFADLAWNAPPGVIIERWRSDLPRLLRNCLLSVSQAGYNTLMDIITSRTRAVVVPFATPEETEQTVRARALAARGVVTLADASPLSPKFLAAAIDRSLTASPSMIDFNANGEHATATIVRDMCKAARASRGAA